VFNRAMQKDTKHKIKDRKKGFTLMEVLVSIAVILSALVGAIALISFTISGISANESKIIAAGLAQEGLEIVRNIRDSNWLAGRTGIDWVQGIPEEFNQRVQYDSSVFLGSGDSQLYKDANDFYSHNNSGTPTLFYRTIDVQYLEADVIKVVCTINWQDKKRSRSIVIETRLYNWYAQAP